MVVDDKYGKGVQSRCRWKRVLLLINEERFILLEELKETAENLHEFETDLQSAKANNIDSVEAYFS